jgi:hypothetical protein
MEDHVLVDPENELALVPVPRKYLPDVYALLGERMAANVESSGEVSYIEGQGPWQLTMIIRLRSNIRLQGIIAVLDACALSPNTDVPMLEVATSIGMPSKQLAAQMGSLSKVTKKLFGHITWPISVRYQDGGQAIYSMNETIAAWWLSTKRPA